MGSVPLMNMSEDVESGPSPHYSAQEMRERVTQPGDRRYAQRSLLCNDLPGGGGQLSLVIGYGMSEDRRQVPRLHAGCDVGQHAAQAALPVLPAGAGDAAAPAGSVSPRALARASLRRRSAAAGSQIWK